MSRDVETINSAPMRDPNIRAIADWLTDGARSAVQPQEILAQLCDQLVACGIPLWRVAVFVRTLHPQVMGRRFVWRPGTEVETSDAPFELLETAEFRDNPIGQVYETGRAIRRRLADPNGAVDFPVLADFRAQGVTDYLASPLLFTDGAIHVVTCTTPEPGGFTDAKIAGIGVMPDISVEQRARRPPQSSDLGDSRQRGNDRFVGRPRAAVGSYRPS